MKSYIYMGMVALTLGVCAEETTLTTVYGKASGTNGKIQKAVTWYADEACTTTTGVITPWDVGSNTCQYVLLGASKIYGSTFPDVPIYFGTDGTTVGTSATAPSFNMTGESTMTFPNATLVSCLLMGNSEGITTLKGSYTILSSGTRMELGATYIADDSYRGFGLVGTFISAADVVTKLSMSFSGATGVQGTGHGSFVFSGDFSSYKGKFNVADVPKKGDNVGYLDLRLTSASALGDPSVSCADAFTLRHRHHLTMSDAVEQTGTRGITLDLAAGEIVSLNADEGDSWTLTTPLAGGADGTLAKIGDGTVTLNGSVAVKNIAVDEGTLVLGSGFTYPAGLSITVAPGATLRTSSGEILEDVALSSSEDSVLALEVPFDATTTNSTPLALSADAVAAVNAWAGDVSVSLSESIMLSVNEELLLPVLTLPSDATLSATLSDSTEKIYKLPVTTFETATDSDTGVQTISLRVRRAIAQTGQRWGGSYDGVITFSDNTTMPQDGADYYWIQGQYSSFSSGIRNTGGNNMESRSFTGGSFTIGGGMLSDYAQDFTLSDLRMYRGSTLRVIRSTGSSVYLERYLMGNITVEPDCTYAAPACIDLSTLSSNNVTEVRSNIAGTGCLRFWYSHDPNTLDMPAKCGLYGDNSGFSGQLVFAAQGGSKFYEICVTNVNAFGVSDGALDGDAIVMSNVWTNVRTVTLKAEQSMTVEDANRGWYVYRGCMRQPEDVVFTLKSPLYVRVGLAKDGPGTLALGCNTSSATGDKPLLVYEGYVQAASTNGFNNLTLNFGYMSAGGIRVDVDETADGVADWGVVPAALTLPDDGVDIAVRVANWTADDGVVTRAILTAPSGTADLTSRLVASSDERNARMVITSRANADGSTTYLVTIGPSGLTVILR